MAVDGYWYEAADGGLEEAADVDRDEKPDIGDNEVVLLTTAVVTTCSRLAVLVELTLCPTAFTKLPDFKTKKNENNIIIVLTFSKCFV